MSKEEKTFLEEEGTNNVYQKTYILPLVTELEIRRTFTEPGMSHTLVMKAHNMHNEDDTATFTWYVNNLREAAKIVVELKGLEIWSAQTPD